MIYNSDIRDFIEVEKHKIKKSKTKVPTIMDLVKDHNQVILLVCRCCGNVFDLRMESKIECPKCNSTNLL